MGAADPRVAQRAREAMGEQRLQELVDNVFRRCMAADLRTLKTIRTTVRVEMAAKWGATRDVTDHALQIAISRNAMGAGEWDYFPAYSTPPRYVSRARVLELAQREVTHGLDVWERQELDEQLADLEHGIAHWRAKHATARAKEAELDALIQRARHHPMEPAP